MILLDTNVVIRFLNGDRVVFDWYSGFFYEGAGFALSAVIEKHIEAFRIIPATIEIAREGGRLRATAKLFNIPLATADKGMDILRREIRIIRV